MLSYISSRFSEAPTSATHEPRAALFLNRFTRTSTIMYATSSVSSILGIQPEQLINKSFYFCIAEDCLQDAVRCFESAKSNDSIAYLRFRFRNPLLAERNRGAFRDMTHSSDEDEDDGGVRLRRSDETSAYGGPPMETARSESRTDESETSIPLTVEEGDKSRPTSGNNTDIGGNAEDAIFDHDTRAPSSTSSVTPIEDMPPYLEPVEVEAVVSCTSDGLVVVIRRARPSLLQSFGPGETVGFGNSFFASPWALSGNEAAAPPEVPVYGTNGPLGASGAAAMSTSAAGPETSTVMKAIREVAVFAWSLTGINGSLIRHSRGQPEGEALPPDGLPVWDPCSDRPENDRFNGFADNSHRRTNMEFIEPSSSEDEIVFKRAKVMPEWRQPSRRAHRDAFDSEADAKEAENGAAPARKRKTGH